MSLAERTRAAVRAHPFLHEALRAGVVNYTAAARFLDLEGEAAVAALRRYAEDLPAYEPPTADARVTMQSGLAETAEDPLLVVGDSTYGPDGGSLTAVLATGEVDATALARVLGRLRAEEVPVEAAGVAGASLLVVVGRREGADALRTVEDALSG
ncbi:MAG: hypothetical protein ABEJ30_04555 [Halorientalis sp.]